MEDTWASRDLPVLDAIVMALEDDFSVDAGRVASAMTGLPADDVERAFYALQGTFTGPVLARLGTGPEALYVKEVTGEARQAVGQWPTADSLVSQLTEAFKAAADQAGDPEEKGRLRRLAELLGGAGRDIAVSVISHVIDAKAHQMGIG